jgi:glyceraldehyde 3-phosphate dehydrogenase
VAINDLTDSKTLAHLLKYDSLLGKLDADVTAGEGQLVVDGKPITVFSERDPANIPWHQREVDIVIEATGFFTDRDKAAVHIHSGGAKRVIISAPGKNDDLTIVMGVNDGLYSRINTTWSATVAAPPTVWRLPRRFCTSISVLSTV